MLYINTHSELHAAKIFSLHSITACAMGHRWKQDVIEDEDENKLTAECVKMIGWQYISTKW